MSAMHYLVPIIVVLGFSVVLTAGLLSVLQDLLERTAESPLIREADVSLLPLIDDEPLRERRASIPRNAYTGGPVNLRAGR